jgi:hypothetical protein
MLVDLVRGHVERLVSTFGLADQAIRVERAYRALAASSLRIAPDACRPELSRINADGTPFQFALHIGAAHPPALQFVGEAGPLGRGGDRIASGLACLDALGDVLGLSDEVARVRPWLDAWTVRQYGDASASAAGAFWFAPAFAPHAPPALTIYLNNAWGRAEDRWSRLGRVCEQLGRPDVERLAASTTLAPLGAALVLRAAAPPRGRAYFSGFGVPVARYREMMASGSHADVAARAFDTFVRHVMAEDAQYPTHSSVFSFEISARSEDAVKVELCGHCAFDSDRQAARRVTAWLTEVTADAGAYTSMLDVVSNGRSLPASGRPGVHAFVGVGMRNAEPYASIYLNPGPLLRAA